MYRELEARSIEEKPSLKNWMEESKKKADSMRIIGYIVTIIGMLPLSFGGGLLVLGPFIGILGGIVATGLMIYLLFDNWPYGRANRGPMQKKYEDFSQRIREESVSYTSNTLYCPNCHRPIPNRRFCPYCGYDLHEKYLNKK